MHIPLPAQPPGVKWPFDDWEWTDPPPGVGHRLNAILDAAFADPQPETTVQTDALLVAHRGRIVAERYARGHGPDTQQPSWSMAKSILHAVVGILVKQAGSMSRSRQPCPHGAPRAIRAPASPSTSCST